MASPPLFHYIIHSVIGLFGKNIFWLRFPSAVFGSLTTLGVALAARHFFGERAGFWAGLLYAVSVFDIFYSQELRMYALVALEALLSVYFWTVAIEKDGWGDWIKFAGASLLGLFTHNWFPFLLLSQGVWFLGERLFKREQVFRGLAVFFVIAAVYMPWIPMVVRQARLPVYGHMHSPGLKDWFSTWAAFAGLKVSSGESLLVINWYLLPVLLGITLGMLGVGAFWPGLNRSRSMRLAFAGLLLPISFAFVESVLGKPVYAPDRYTIIALPSYFLVVSRAFEVVSQSWRKVLVAGAVLWVGSSAVMLQRYYFQYRKAPGKEIAGFIDMTRAPTEPVTLCADPARSDWGLELYTSATITHQPLDECRAEGTRYVVLETRMTIPSRLRRLHPVAVRPIGELTVFKMVAGR